MSQQVLVPEPEASIGNGKTSFKEDCLLTSVEWGFVAGFIAFLATIHILYGYAWLSSLGVWAASAWRLYIWLNRKDWAFVRKAKHYGKYTCLIIFGVSTIVGIVALIFFALSGAGNRYGRRIIID